MPLILPGNVASATASTTYDVDNSCRFDSASLDQLSRNTVSATDAQKFTLSVWLKRSQLNSSAGACRFYQGYLDGDNRLYMQFDTSDKLFIYGATGGTAEIHWQSARIFRDTAAWYHLVFQADSTDGTQADRMKAYVNNELIVSWSKTSSPNQNFDWGNQIAQTNGNLNISGENTAAEIFDGYMAEVCFIDGLALPPTSFGEYNSDSPTIWQPKDVSGLTFGNNGFYLDFKDSANLGNDASGGTDFTEDNLTSIAQATDTPTNNFATLNPLSRYAGTFANGNCSQTGGNDIASTIGVTTGKWYWEVKRVDSNNVFHTGICSTNKGMTGGTMQFLNGESGAMGSAIYIHETSSGTIGYASGAGFSSTSYNSFASPLSIGSGDIVGFALDLDSATKKLDVYQNGSSIGDVTFSYDEENPIFIWSRMNTSVQGDFNFGNPVHSISSGNADDNGYGNFEYAPPSGYYAICTKNLAEFG